MTFEIRARLDAHPLARTGVLATPHGEIATPAFVPVGTKATVKAVAPEAIADVGAQAVLACSRAPTSSTKPAGLENS